MKTFEWNGVMPAVTTKFNDDDSLDLELFKMNIQAQLSAGVSGIILGGTLGEASTLTTEEKRTLVKETLRIVGQKIPVIINIAESSTSAAVLAAKYAEEDGAQGLMMLPPMRYKADDREVVTFFKTVAQSTSLPIMIYNNPVDYGVEVSIEMFEEPLKDRLNIQAVKESTRDISNITRLSNRFGRRLSIFTGVDTLALESLVVGADGWVAGLVCAFPAETVAIFNLVKLGRLEEALKIYRWFLPLLELDINAKLVQNIKLAEVATGLGSEPVRAPRLPLVGAERKKVLQIIESSIKSRPVLPQFEQKQLAIL